MGKVMFLDPIDYISGKISKKFRTVYNRRRLSDRRYTQVRDERKTPVSVRETKQRNKFRVAQLAALDRSMDLSKISGDQDIYLLERKKAGFKYTTFRGWLFGKAYKYYDEETNQVQWPEQL